MTRVPQLLASKISQLMTCTWAQEVSGMLFSVLFLSNGLWDGNPPGVLSYADEFGAEVGA